MPVKLSEIAGRNNLPKFLNEHGLVGEAVEVGTHRGIYATHFLKHWKGALLHCIDPWVSGYDPNDPASHGDRQIDKKIAFRNLKPFLESTPVRVRILEGFSPETARRFYNESLDCVYIDACHTYEAFRADLNAWWVKIKPSGIISGHDIVSGSKPGEGYGKAIMKAVQEFCNDKKLDFYLIPELPMKNWSFYIQKPEIKKP